MTINRKKEIRKDQLNATFQRQARKDKDTYIQNICIDIEKHSITRNTGTLFKKIKEISGTFPARIGSIKNKNGLILTEAEEQSIRLCRPQFAMENTKRNGLPSLIHSNLFHQIKSYFFLLGLTPVKKREVLELYGSDTLPQSVLFGNEGSEYGGDVQLKRTLMGPVEYKKVYVDNNLNNVLVLEIGLFQFDQVSTMVQLSDLFSVPEILLLSQVTEVSVSSIHPSMRDIITMPENIENYLEKKCCYGNFLECLRNAGKKLFIVTNSPFSFVNSGMCYLLGPSWQKFFDVVVVQARKPHFFQEHNRPFRIYDPLLKRHKWERIYQFESSKIYMEGTVNQFHAMTGWENSRVLYFGDHVYADLIDATLDKGWKTGAIISELQDEINILNSNECKHALKWLQTLQLLIEDVQDKKIGNDFIRKLMAEREEVRLTTKHLFNRQFGSMFRTFHNPTFFSRRLFRFSDIYTSKLTNLLNYNVNHTFYPRRGALPHEYCYNSILRFNVNNTINKLSIYVKKLIVRNIVNQGELLL
ncbi:5'-nucleotidase domain-containing protein 2 [Nymphon striatum]|nr:5'-nucleotidase domain-containing protein 2 [Nymphon striatum]